MTNINKNKGKFLSMLTIAVIISGIVIISGCVGENPQETGEKVTLRFTSPPDPNMIPAFILLDQGKLDKYGIELKYIPSKGPSDLMAHLQKGDVDFALFSAPGGAKMYSKGITNIKLVGVHVWKAIYVVSEKNISGWEDLKGKRVLIAFRGGPPDIITRASMKLAGFNPNKDFNIEYLPSGAEIKRLILSGRADAAVFPEPHISQLLIKSKGKLHIAVKPQQGLYKNISGWDGEQLPLGALWVIPSNVKGKEEAVKKFISAFSEADNYAMTHPEEAGEITARYFKKYFHSEFPKEAISNSIRSGRLELDFKKINRTDLNTFLKILKYPTVDEEFFYKW